MDYLQRVEQVLSGVARVRRFDASMVSVLRGPTRVPEVNELRAEIKQLGVDQLSYFEEGLDCIQFAQASRASIVLGWTGFVDLLQIRVSNDNFDGLNSILKESFRGIYKKQPKILSVSQLSKYFDDALLLEAGRKLSIFQTHAFKQLDAMRDERNNCAHVAEYAITPRIALGYYAKLIAFLPLVL